MSSTQISSLNALACLASSRILSSRSIFCALTFLLLAIASSIFDGLAFYQLSKVASNASTIQIDSDSAGIVFVVVFAFFMLAISALVRSVSNYYSSLFAFSAVGDLSGNIILSLLSGKNQFLSTRLSFVNLLVVSTKEVAFFVLLPLANSIVAMLITLGSLIGLSVGDRNALVLVFISIVVSFIVSIMTKGAFRRFVAKRGLLQDKYAGICQAICVDTMFFSSGERRKSVPSFVDKLNIELRYSQAISSAIPFFQKSLTEFVVFLMLVSVCMLIYLYGSDKSSLFSSVLVSLFFLQRISPSVAIVSGSWSTISANIRTLVEVVGAC